MMIRFFGEMSKIRIKFVQPFEMFYQLQVETESRIHLSECFDFHSFQWNNADLCFSCVQISQNNGTFSHILSAFDASQS